MTYFVSFTHTKLVWLQKCGFDTFWWCFCCCFGS